MGLYQKKRSIGERIKKAQRNGDDCIFGTFKTVEDREITKKYFHRTEKRQKDERRFNKAAPGRAGKNLPWPDFWEQEEWTKSFF